MRRSILACGLLLAFAGMATAAAAATASKNDNQSNPSLTADTSTPPAAGTTTTADTPDPAQVRWEKHQAAVSLRHIRRYRADTRHWLTVMRGRPPAMSRSLSARSLGRLRQLARHWQHRAHAAWVQATHPPQLSGWLCIHRYEGSWADAGGPYWGGLQMDLGFQRTYGGWLLQHKGTADHWSPLEQIWVAVRASHTRGFSPWPSTARYCGLL